MAFKIIAATPDDGWGAVTDGDDTFVLSPPYQEDDKTYIFYEEIEKLVAVCGYHICNIECATLDEVAGVLRQMYIESKRKHGIEPPSLKKLKEFLKYATDDVLLEYLDRANDELIPEGDIKTAREVATDLLELQSVQDNPKLRYRAEDILRRCATGEYK